MVQPLHESSFEIALDLGHSSIGWAVFQNGKKFNLLGTGVVLFPADDCLAVKRRAYRRQRRHVRATRQRIERLKKLLMYIGALSELELNQPGCAWPWKLAAEVLRGSGRILTWSELWDVLRWYAHNRGYDGNARWSRLEEEDSEDTERVQTARGFMQQYATQTMAETFCAVLKVNPLGITKSSRERFKGLNAAFPREKVYAEVKVILEKHLGVLPHLTSEIIGVLVGNDDYYANRWDDDAWKAVAVPTVSLPKRYVGSYLFGQSIPRFDNRIISSCPITYERILAKTGDPKQAVRDSKVPVKKCREFLLYRWAMVLANLRVNKGRGMEPLTSEERKAIHEVMVKGDSLVKNKPGHLTKKQFKDAVIQKTGALLNNIDAYFLTPRADEALWLRPDNLPTGRAPYTRQVLKEAIREVFTGKHPTEEGGCLYRSEAIKQAQLQRTLEEKTNNHLVRHRVLITRRLVQDIIKAYATGNAAHIGRITIEVNRDLQAFSGMTNKEIEGELNQMLKDHGNVVKKLEKDLADSKHRITAGLIRKARIAEDLDWTCPYTGKDYDAIDLATGAFDKDHIIPRSLRPSDSLESLVITSRAINAMKGNRTALQFIKEFAGKEIEGAPSIGGQKPNLFTEKLYRQFVTKLDVKNGHKQDRERKKSRIKLLELEQYEEKGFLPKDLTQTSHLVRLAATELEKEFTGLENKPRIVSLPGSVTGEIRKSWKLYGCLAAHNPEVQKLLERAETEELNIKKELRGITHQHHALDACIIGLASHFLPNEGGLWEILVKRNRRPDETALLFNRGIFSRDGEGRARLAPLRDEFKQQITKCLSECRVVQHVPKRMDGLAGLEENTRGIVAIEVPETDSGTGKKVKEPKLKEIWNNQSELPLPVFSSLDGAIVHLQQYSARDSKNGDRRTKKFTEEKAAKLLGLMPKNANGKLRAIKGVRIVTANFGLALWRKDGKPDGEPQTRIILWHKVWPQLKAIAEKENDGKWPEIFRNGQIIHVLTSKGRSDYQGYWQIVSIKNNDSGMAFDIIRPDMANLRNKVEWAGINVSVNTLIKCGMTVVNSGLTGVPLNM
jgi:hypothetical protein